MVVPVWIHDDADILYRAIVLILPFWCQCWRSFKLTIESLLQKGFMHTAKMTPESIGKSLRKSLRRSSESHASLSRFNSLCIDHAWSFILHPFHADHPQTVDHLECLWLWKYMGVKLFVMRRRLFWTLFLFTWLTFHNLRIFSKRAQNILVQSGILSLTVTVLLVRACDSIYSYFIYFHCQQLCNIIIMSNLKNNKIHGISIIRQFDRCSWRQCDRIKTWLTRGRE